MGFETTNAPRRLGLGKPVRKPGKSRRTECCDIRIVFVLCQLLPGFLFECRRHVGR